MIVTRFLLAGLLGGPLVPLANAEAGDPAKGEAPGTTVYTAADLSQFAPRTALEMVERIPGVAISEDDDGSRGFGQASGNVLIDGQRVSGKSNGTRAALGRIPVSRVVRIDVADASVFGVSGLTGQAINVVTMGNGAVTGAWRMQARWRDDFEPSLGVANLSLSGGRGALNWTLEADNAPERRGNKGYRTITNGAGTLTEVRDEKFFFFVDQRSLSGSLGWKPDRGPVGNLNFKAVSYEQQIRERAKTFPAAGLEGRRIFESSENEWNAEIGGDLEFDAIDGRLKVIGLIRREHSPVSDLFLRGGLDGSNLFSSDFRQTANEGEYILRGEYTRTTKAGSEWQLSAEGAFNFLDVETALSESVGGGPFISVDLDSSNTRVEEQRGEAFITHTRSLSKRLTLQIAAGLEQSVIAQSGDTAKERTFTRPKGYSSLSWQASDSLKLVTRLERDVGQLDFFDFVSSVDLSQGNGNAGNPDIVPLQLWGLSVQAEKDFGKWGAATAKVTLEAIEDIPDRVPIGTGDGPGNLDAAEAVSAELNATLKLEPVGLKGAEITTEVVWIDSRVDDPLTGESRPISDDLVYEISTEFRQDVPGTNFAWGASLEALKFTEEFTFNERRHEILERGMGEVFVERKDLRGMTARFSVRNVLDQQDRNLRAVFSPDRRGASVRVEDSRRERGTIFLVTLSGTF